MAPPALNLRDRISSPLEAGPSILDCHQLPSHVNGALEYASKRLARKSTNITLVVVSRDYQLPSSASSSPTFTPGWFTPGSLPVSAVTTPSRLGFPPAPPSKLDALKQLWSHSSSESPIRERILHVHLDRFRDGNASPAFSEASTASSSTYSSVSTADSISSQRLRWPGSPMSASVPLTPATPFTIMSSSTDTSSALSSMSMGMNQVSRFGIRLMYAQTLDDRDVKILSQTLEKAAKKFRLGPNWMPQAVHPSALGLPIDLIQKSLARRETLFQSSNLTLVSLDQLYNFRTALQAYARTKASCRLEDAVDELRRLFLANGRCPLPKSTLLTSYRWLDPVSEAALADVCHMYERAYGGIEKESGVQNDIDSSPAWPLCHPDSDSDSDSDGSPLPDPEKLPITHINLSSLNKELLISSDLEKHDDEQEEDEEDIEAWYRQVHSAPPTTVIPKPILIDPLRSHPPVLEIPPPPPSPPPPPPPPAPTFSITPPPASIAPTTATTMAEPLSPERQQNSTPKLRPAPPGRSLALKLQTSFSATQLKKPVATRPTLNIPSSPVNNEDEEEIETARPISAVRTTAGNLLPAVNNNNNNNHNNNARWKNTGSVMTIDQMLQGRASGNLEVDGNSKDDSRVGPMTPNGYDDISPITRGEWGFLMFGQAKKGGVGVC